jgi:hypothetical protein
MRRRRKFLSIVGACGIGKLGFGGVERPSGGRKTGGSRVRSAGPTTEDESYVPQERFMRAAGGIFLA